MTSQQFSSAEPRKPLARQKLTIALEIDVRAAVERVAARERRTLSNAVNAMLARELTGRGELGAAA
jgi:hypothetical protein